MLQARIDSAGAALAPKPLASGGEFTGKVTDVVESLKGLTVSFNLDPVPLRSPSPAKFIVDDRIHVGQLRKNRDYSTIIRVLAPPRTTHYGVDNTWLVEYLSTGRTERRSSRFIREFYPKVRVTTTVTPPSLRPRPGQRNPYRFGTPSWYRWENENLPTRRRPLHSSTY